MPHTPSWVTPHTVVVGTDPYPAGPIAIPDHAAGVIGRGRLVDPRVQYTFVKNGDGSTRLLNFRFIGAYEDLYDFNYEDSALARNAAALQIAYGKGTYGRSYGVIYRNRILLDNVYQFGTSPIVGTGNN